MKNGTIEDQNNHIHYVVFFSTWACCVENCDLKESFHKVFGMDKNSQGGFRCIFHLVGSSMLHDHKKYHTQGFRAYIQRES